jgi:thioester reductase-like protein
VGRQDNFFELGGDSIRSLQVVSRAQEAGLPITVRDIFQYQTLEALARASHANKDKKDKGLPVELNEPIRDLATEVVLDPTIVPEMRSGTLATPNNILLTGGSGFLGTFLLSEILRHTQATIHCLVRSSDANEGQISIIKRLKSFGLWDESLTDRIIPVPGDLSKPLLGLSHYQFREMSEIVDAIYHNGATVNLAYPYEFLKPTNVFGTQEILRMAADSHVKPVHFVSTTAVFAPLNPQECRCSTCTFVRTSQISPTTDGTWQSLVTGYAQSKWVAEKLIATANSRGIPVVIYRPSFIAGYTGSGAGNSEDLLSRFIRACMQVECVPDIDLNLNMMPVDYVSSAVVALSMRKDVFGRAFNLINVQPTNLRELSDCILSSGLLSRKVSYDDWRSRCGSHGSLAPLLTLLPQDLQTTTSSVGPEFDYQDTVTWLEEEGILCPEITPQLLRKYVAYSFESDAKDRQLSESTSALIAS